MKKLSPLFWVGVGFLILVMVFAIVGPNVRHSWQNATGHVRMPPGSDHWLGTDEQGRDVFARLAYGARITLIIGLSVQSLALIVGVTVGVLGVFGPRWLSSALLRLTDGMFAFPDLLLAIMLVGLFGRGTWPVVTSLAIASWPGVARLARTQIASFKDREFVVAAKAMGATVPYLVRRHILPHLVGILLAIAMVDVAAVILSESTLSFLGIGVQLPETSWGGMIQGGNSQKESNPLLLLWPCLALASTVFALNFVGDGLRKVFDPTASHVR